MYNLKLTDEQYATIYTALRLERLRSWGGDAGIVKQIQDAIDALVKAERRVAG